MLCYNKIVVHQYFPFQNIFSNYIILISIMYLKMFFPIFLFALTANAANRMNLPHLVKVESHDETQIIRLAQEEKFTIPLSGRTITNKITYIPKMHHECEFIKPKIQYKALAESMAIFDSENQISDILPLLEREIAFVADPFYNIASYSIDTHFLMKPQLPKTSITGSQTSSQRLIEPFLVASENEEYIYYLTSEKSFVFSWNSVSSAKEFSLEGNPQIRKAITYKGYVILCADVGILVFQMNQQTHLLEKIQTVEIKDRMNPPIDIQINSNTQMLYVLNYQKTIQTYVVDPKFNQQGEIQSLLHPEDEINLNNITLNHDGNSVQSEYIGHINIQISQNREEQTLMILFNHNMKTVIAELNYQPSRKEFIFVRYYKFSLEVKDIQIIEDVMVVVGQQVLGMFPYGIHPSLIDEEFNGFITLSSLQKVKVTSQTFLVGANRNSLEYGGLFLNNEAGLNCHIESNSKLKSISFEANLTTCDDNEPPELAEYCEYKKTFIIEQMDLTTSAPVATSIWILMIVFTLLVVAGLCCIFVMHKKKERQIRKLELYFEEKRRTEVPASSDRNH